MKVMKPFAVILFLSVAFLPCGAYSADGSSISTSSDSNNYLTAPKLAVGIDGTKVTLTWSKVAGATGYTLYYTEYPYDDNPDSIKSGHLGNITSLSFELPPGSAYMAAVTACGDGDSPCSSSSNTQKVVIPLPTFRNSIGQEFIHIPAGVFLMGSPLNELGRKSDEIQHQVTLTQPFYMQTTEVTQAQWDAVMGSNWSHFFGCPACPVEMVSWDDAQMFVAEMNLRGEGTYSLPTEAQWEYAARAGSATGFHDGRVSERWCGSDPHLEPIGWYCYNAESQTHEAGAKAPNAWGLHDMSGNVGEWCLDWYGGYPLNAVTDPTGPLSGSSRVLRGGGWDFYAMYCRSANRGYYSPAVQYNFTGFRLVKQP